MAAAPEDLRISPATENEIPLILQFIRKLADYERLSDHVTADEESLRAGLFGVRPLAEVIIAHVGEHPAGFALFFHNFSTFVGKPGIYLEDLFVEPEYRRRGVGKALLSYLAGLVRERGCARLEWAVLDWNEAAINFYTRIGAVGMHDWTVFRLTGKALHDLADGKVE
jgi:GNAT superfamily N-acetyltransferase